MHTGYREPQHEIDPETLHYKAGDGFRAAARGKSTQLAVFLDSSGRTYAVPAHALPSARGQGDPLTGRVSPPDGASFVGLMLGNADEPSGTSFRPTSSAAFSPTVFCGWVATHARIKCCSPSSVLAKTQGRCKKRGFCPSCAGRRMAETAAHLVEQVIPWVPTRQWVVSVPIPLHYWMAASTHLMAQVHTIICRTIHQHYVNQAVKQGHPREQVQAGSITFVQRFGSSLNLNLHYHLIVLDGVYRDRSAQGLKPKFVKMAPPSDADIATVVRKIGQRVIVGSQHIVDIASVETDH